MPVFSGRRKREKSFKGFPKLAAAVDSFQDLRWNWLVPLSSNWNRCLGCHFTKGLVSTTQLKQTASCRETDHKIGQWYIYIQYVQVVETWMLWTIRITGYPFPPSNSHYRIITFWVRRPYSTSLLNALLGWGSIPKESSRQTHNIAAETTKKLRPGQQYKDVPRHANVSKIMSIYFLSFTPWQ